MSQQKSHTQAGLRKEASWSPGHSAESDEFEVVLSASTTLTPAVFLPFLCSLPRNMAQLLKIRVTSSGILFCF